MFQRPETIPQYLRYSQPKETQLSNNVMKKMQKEFDEFNSKLISRASKVKKKNFNLPQKLRIALNELKTLVKNKEIDIRRVDKGQLILVIDYEQRKKIEESPSSPAPEPTPSPVAEENEGEEEIYTFFCEFYAFNSLTGYSHFNK